MNLSCKSIIHDFIKNVYINVVSSHTEACRMSIHTWSKSKFTLCKALK